MQVLQSVRAWANRIKRDAVTLWFAARHPGTPWPAKALGAFVVAYALSPIDLIPDFIPVLGFVDDAIVLPGLIWLTLRLVPASVLDECRAQAADWLARGNAKPRSHAGMAIVIALWLAAAFAAWRWWAAS
jgi:uncharacterized membrane protein YkvA (DUF1232 family)